MTRPALPFVPLLPFLSGDGERFWPTANKRLLWGWKRDVGYESRLVFYAGRLVRRAGMVGVTDQHFLYIHRTDAAVAHRIAATFEHGRERIEPTVGRLAVEVRPATDGHAIVEVSIGVPGAEEERLTTRLRRRRPRRSIAPVPDVAPAAPRDLGSLLPADLYVGSGLSYEAGLATLCEMHDAFRVDHPSGTRFMHGAEDDLPRRIAEDPAEAVADFCQVHVQALHAAPTAAMGHIAALHAAGLVGEVYTDNVDNLLAKSGVPFIRTRGSGVLNERCEVALPSPTLVVVGVAADRRDVVAQARARRRRVVVVNPCSRVAPHVRHLGYLRERDTFFKTTADAFFDRLASEVTARTARTARVEAIAA